MSVGRKRTIGCFLMFVILLATVCCASGLSPADIHVNVGKRAEREETKGMHGGVMSLKPHHTSPWADKQDGHREFSRKRIHQRILLRAWAERFPSPLASSLALRGGSGIAPPPYRRTVGPSDSIWGDCEIPIILSPICCKMQHCFRSKTVLLIFDAASHYIS